MSLKSILYVNRGTNYCDLKGLRQFPEPGEEKMEMNPNDFHGVVHDPSVVAFADRREEAPGAEVS